MSVTWIDNKYGAGCRATIGTGLIISIACNVGTKNGPSPSFKVAIFGALLKKDFSDRNEAKQVAEAQAKLWLTNALKTFDLE